MSKKQDLQGWSLVLAVKERALNNAFLKDPTMIPSQYRNVDFSTEADMSKIGLGIKRAKFTADLGVIQVHCKRNDLKLADFYIAINSGMVSYKAAGLHVG